MNEEEWLNSPHSGPRLRAVRHLVSDRKYRLFICACARHVLPANAHPDIHRGVEVAEQMADGTASQTAIESALALFGSLSWVHEYEARGFVGENEFLASFAIEAVRPRAHQTRIIGVLSDYEAETGIENQHGQPQLRDIFGNPFRPVDFTAWRTDTALTLARQMYDSRDFGAMPILADALQDAGCDNEDVLRHCRDAGATHYRGCWVVDGVLRLQ